MAKAQVALDVFTIKMIEPLPIAFKAKERIYRQLARKGIVALYEVYSYRHVKIGYELSVIRFRSARTYPDGRQSPPHEQYPGDEEFGKCAWSLPLVSRNLAELCFEQLVATSPLPKGYEELSKTSPEKDLRARGYQARGPTPDRERVMKFLTGRPLPKTPNWWRKYIRQEEPIEVHPSEFSD